MSPANAVFYTAYMARPNTIINRYFALKAIICAYSFDLLFSQFCGCASLTTIASSMLYSVSLICGRCVPSKVSKEIVLRISIAMTAFMSFWWSTNKSKKDKTMYFHHFAFVLNPQKYIQPAIFWARGWLFYPTGLNCPDASMVRYFIQPFKSNNGFPRFHFVPLKNMRYGIVPDWSTVC